MQVLLIAQASLDSATLRGNRAGACPSALPNDPTINHNTASTQPLNGASMATD
jgi:hypothetical protein